MDVFNQVANLRAAVSAWRRAGQRIGFVPTMGNLHAGHYALIDAARSRCDKVVASVFVNPTQFGPNEDFARYPRTPEQDIEGLHAHGCDAVLLPEVETMYPFGSGACVAVEVPSLSDVLCGAFRPGHFAGVATVVLRLFNMVQPDLAVFGRKDLQQLELIRYLVRDLALPIEILGMPTQREADGLARSSRNQYLSPAERALAPQIHANLRIMLTAAAAGEAATAVEGAAAERLRAAGFCVDYAVLRREGQLAEPLAGQVAAVPDLVALIAARLGKTRLIDNLAASELG